MNSKLEISSNSSKTCVFLSFSLFIFKSQKSLKFNTDQGCIFITSHPNSKLGLLCTKHSFIASIFISKYETCSQNMIDKSPGNLNPFLSVHIPYVQSEGILPQIRLLQWRAYIFRNTQCFSTKLGRNMVNALFCHQTLKYWWPLTYIQGHVIQDGCQIQSEKSILGQKIAITRPIFWQIW